MKARRVFIASQLVQLGIDCPWTAQEDQTLFELQSSFGNKWTSFCKSFTGQTPNEIKY